MIRSLGYCKYIQSPFCSYGAGAASGDYVVAKNDEQEATFKQYKRFDNTRVLHPLNPKYPDIVLNKDLEYRIVGVVMEKKKRYK
jgi:SOS-response transcriptional repressor LexA